MRRLVFVLLVLPFGGLLASDDHEQAYRLREHSEILPLEQIVDGLGLGPNDRILEIETEFEGERRIYEIEYVTGSGIIKEVEVDARSGEVLRTKEEE
jgi:uncharacterized membrane protein YkoI